jgi:hypothetical protein
MHMLNKKTDSGGCVCSHVVWCILSAQLFAGCFCVQEAESNKGRPLCRTFIERWTRGPLQHGQASLTSSLVARKAYVELHSICASIMLAANT